MLDNSKDVEKLFDELFPLPRSITGKGYRQSMEILSRYIPFKIEKTASGSEVFDWIVPQEWAIEDAYLLAPNGDKILDFQKNAFDIIYDAIQQTQQQVEKLTEPLLKNMPGVPDDLKNTLKKNQEDFKKAVDESFVKAETYFSSASSPEKK